MSFFYANTRCWTVTYFVESPVKQTRYFNHKFYKGRRFQSNPEPRLKSIPSIHTPKNI